MVRIVVALVCLAVSSPTLAQQRIFALVPESGVTSLWEGHVEGGQVVSAVQRLAVASTATTGPVLAAGGTFVVWSVSTGAATALVAYDRLTGATHVLPGTIRPGVSDPTTPRLYVQSDGYIAALTQAGLARVPGTAGLAPIGVSPDGRHLHALRPMSAGPPASYQVEIVDTRTGALIAAVPAPDLESARVSGDESWIWVVARPAAVPVLRKLAVPSGEVTLTIPLATGPVAGYYEMTAIDERRRRVFVSLTYYGSTRYAPPSTVSSFDTETGVRGPVVSRPGPGTAFLDSGRGVVLSQAQSCVVPAGCGEAQLQVLSAATGVELSRAGLGTTAYVRVAFDAPPPPPSVDEPVISPTRTVTVSWARAPELVAGFTVEAGSAPGLANIAVLPVTSGTTLTVPNVTPGTYYVRVRAWNYIGASVPSNEIVVVVP